MQNKRLVGQPLVLRLTFFCGCVNVVNFFALTFVHMRNLCFYNGILGATIAQFVYFNPSYPHSPLGFKGLRDK